MSRNYTLPTIKTLFGEASACAYPGCGEPLIFTDRGKKTAIAEIAHIRSELRGGPRHDPDYTGDVNGPGNLLLLCGKHHKPVDRHESTYSVAELERWKVAQRASARGGTELTGTDLRSYSAIGSEDRRIVTDIARLAQRAAGLNRIAQAAIYGVEDEDVQDRSLMWAKSVGVTGAPPPAIELSEPHRDKLDEVLGKLEEEVAVLDMTSPGPVADAAKDVMVHAFRAGILPDHLKERAGNLRVSLRRLWKVANGEIEPGGGWY
ncbi:HNH endonuclease signature motif containing protein [Geodermatophilus sp. DSM 45219]|uniref:HNH endonuclease signature motif containing protein n=1 Tax=Geodermatophilus sp. DSM 45219 TaxID=1881103 RepID=UPI00115F8353|nr:HNH endonuclease signature motif containing protein [Geodermatophilus sp. DSM 45219]